MSHFILSFRDRYPRAQSALFKISRLPSHTAPSGSCARATAVDPLHDASHCRPSVRTGPLILWKVSSLPPSLSSQSRINPPLRFRPLRIPVSSWVSRPPVPPTTPSQYRFTWFEQRSAYSARAEGRRDPSRELGKRGCVLDVGAVRRADRARLQERRVRGGGAIHHQAHRVRLTRGSLAGALLFRHEFTTSYWCPFVFSSALVSAAPASATAAEI